MYPSPLCSVLYHTNLTVSILYRVNSSSIFHLSSIYFYFILLIERLKMASTLTQSSGLPPHQLSSTLNQTPVQESQSQGIHDVITTFNYYKDPGDGSPPPPNDVSKPESYHQPVETRSAIVHDIRGTEDQYTLDKNGFQIYKHQSVENDFVDDEQIKQVYYPETERLLKEVYVPFVTCLS